MVANYLYCQYCGLIKGQLLQSHISVQSRLFYSSFFQNPCRNYDMSYTAYSNRVSTHVCRIFIDVGGVLLKGQSHEIFDPRFFSWINPTWVTDQRVKIVLHMVENSQRNSRKCFDSLLCRIAPSRNSPLCRIARSCDSPLCGIARSRLPTVPHSVESAIKIFTWISH
jgi:hypothetical protein